MNKPKVIIDSGHGGQTDIGLSDNLGYDNIKEKDINLEIAVRLAWLCGSHGIGYQLTRWGDRYIALSERCRRANRTGAELFLSIHCNYASSENARGIETYYLSKSGKFFANKFQDTLLELGYSNDRGIKKSEVFYVLKKTKMPAVLLELGFLSNKEDALYLNNENNQMLIATNLFHVIQKLFPTDKPVVKKRSFLTMFYPFRKYLQSS